MNRSALFRITIIILLLVGLIVPAVSQSGRKTRPREVTGSSRDKASDNRSDKEDRAGSDKPLADNTPVEFGDDGTIRLDTSLVNVPVSVTDRDGKFIPYLKKSDFRIFEDGVRQEIENFESVEVPFNVVLMIDTSNSTRFRLEDIHQAAFAFIEELRPEDRVMVVSFDSRYRVQSEFTNDRYRLREAIYNTRPGGSTKLYEAVDNVLNRLEEVQGRKAIVIFTDGVDTSSRRASADSNIEMVEESGALVYPISYDTEEDVRGRRGGSRGGGRNDPIIIPPIIDIIPIPLPRLPRDRSRRRPFNDLINFQFPGQWPQGRVPPGYGSDDYRKGALYLQELAERSGGRLHHAETIGNVNRAFSLIAEELRHMYALGYYPTNTTKDGTYRSVKVRVNKPNLVVRARDGYRAIDETHAGNNPTNTETDPETGRPVMKRKQLAEHERNRINE